VSWWPDAWTKQAALWTYTQRPRGGSLVAQPDEHYVTGVIRSVLPGPVRRGIKRYYGVVHSACTVGDLNSGVADLQRIVVPAALRDIDERTVSNAMQLSAPMFGPVPYRGGPVSLEVGLFAIRTTDLTGPFLDVLLDVANAATVAFLPVAQPLASVVVRGMQALTGSGGNAVGLEMGLARSFDRPASTDHILVKARRGDLDISSWTIGDDDLPHNADGIVPTRYPWLALTLEVSTERDDWYMIPALREAYAQVRGAVTNGRRDEARSLVEALRLRALACPDLLPRDAVRLHGKVEGLVREAFPGGPTAGNQVDIGPLENIALYS
jgi:hypothetical protein